MGMVKWDYENHLIMGDLQDPEAINGCLMGMDGNGWLEHGHLQVNQLRIMVFIYIYICVYIYLCIYVYIYIHIFLSTLQGATPEFVMFVGL